METHELVVEMKLLERRLTLPALIKEIETLLAQNLPDELRTSDVN